MHSKTSDHELYPGCTPPPEEAMHTPVTAYGQVYPQASDAVWKFNPLKGIQLGGSLTYMQALHQMNQFSQTDPTDYLVDEMGEIRYDPHAGNLTLNEARRRQLNPGYLLTAQRNHIIFGGPGCDGACGMPEKYFRGQQYFSSQSACLENATHLRPAAREQLVHARAPVGPSPGLMVYL